MCKTGQRDSGLPELVREDLSGPATRVAGSSGLIVVCKYTLFRLAAAVRNPADIFRAASPAATIYLRVQPRAVPPYGGRPKTFGHLPVRVACGDKSFACVNTRKFGTP
jgi:hypothetical protein